MCRCHSCEPHFPGRKTAPWQWGPARRGFVCNQAKRRQAALVMFGLEVGGFWDADTVPFFASLRVPALAPLRPAAQASSLSHHCCSALAITFREMRSFVLPGPATWPELLADVHGQPGHSQAASGPADGGGHCASDNGTESVSAAHMNKNNGGQQHDCFARRGTP